MSRFFVQLFLSIVVGVGAAIGFGPQAIKIRQEVKASLREHFNVTFPAIGGLTTQLRTNASVSAQTQVKSVIKEVVKLDTKEGTSLDGRVTSNDNNVNVSPQVSLNGSLNTNAQTNTGADAVVQGGIDMKLKDTIKTNFDLISMPDLNLLP